MSRSLEDVRLLFYMVSIWAKEDDGSPNTNPLDASVLSENNVP